MDFSPSSELLAGGRGFFYIYMWSFVFSKARRFFLLSVFFIKRTNDRSVELLFGRAQTNKIEE